MKKTVISILGATGLVGADVVTALSTMDAELRLFASEESAGEVYKVGNDEVVVQVPSSEALAGSDVILCCLPPQEARRLLPSAVATNAVVIDNSGELRTLWPESVLSMPMVEHGVGNKRARLFSLASPVTSQIVPILFSLAKLSPITSVRATVLFAASSAGRAGLDELWEQTKSIYTQTELPQEIFDAQVAFNCVPYAGEIDPQTGSTHEEVRVAEEIRDLLKEPLLPIDLTLVRVPVFHSHAVILSVQTSNETSMEQVRSTLEKFPGITLHKDQESIPEPVTVAGEEVLHIGRLRKDGVGKHGLTMWVVADNIRYGAVHALVEAVRQFTATEN